MDTREFYAGISRRYHLETFGELSSTRAFDRRMRTDAVLELVLQHVPRGALIADLGCGPAQYAAPLLGKGYSYTGVDIAAEMFQVAASELAGRAEARFLQGSIEALPLDADSVDAALVIGVIEYVRGDDRSIAEVHRVLKTGGIAIVTFPNALNPVHALRTLARPIVGPGIRALAPNSRLGRTVYASGIPYRVLSRSRFVRKMQRAGFALKDSHCHGYGIFPWDRPLTPAGLRRRLRREVLGARLFPMLGSNLIVCMQKT